MKRPDRKDYVNKKRTTQLIADLEIYIDYLERETNKESASDNTEHETLAGVSVPLPEKIFEIDFGGDCKAEIVVNDGLLKVTKAMNGWGNGISSDDINITERQ